LVETLELPTFLCPNNPAEDAADAEKRKWQRGVDSIVVRETGWV
jgi:hypothetical protein